MADAAKEKLMTVLQSRKLPLDLEDIGKAFESQTTSPDLIAWIDEYLHEATLLTKDELDFYNNIEDSTKLELSTASHEVVPLQDRDIKEAIAALKSSSSAIESHAKVLEAQKETLLALSNRHVEEASTSSLTNKYAQESNNLNFAIEDLKFQIDNQLKEVEDRTIKAITAIKSFSIERLAADDRVLEALSGLSSKVSETSNSGVSRSDLDLWLSTLATLRIDEVKARIDGMLSPTDSATKRELGDEGAELRAEIATLKEDIDSVVHMAIGHELRNPILKGIETFNDSERQHWQDWSRYLIATLKYLNSQLDVATNYISDLVSYSDTIIAIRNSIVKIGNESRQDTHETTARPAILQSRRVPSGTQIATQSGIHQALRRLNVSSGESNDQSTALTRLNTLVTDSITKLQAQYLSAEIAVLETLGTSLAPKQRDALAIHQQLYASSSFSTLRLFKAELDASIIGLQKKIDDLAPQIARTGSG